MTTKISPDESRIFELARAQKLDPQRAIAAHRRVAAITDQTTKDGVRRQLSGVVLPVDPADGDTKAFLTGSHATGDQIEATQNEAETFIHDFYTGEGRRFLALYLLESADSAIRQIPVNIVERNALAVPNGANITSLTAIAGCRPDKTWLLTGLTTPGLVMHQIRTDLHCDFDVTAGTEFGSCMDRHQESLKLSVYADGRDANGQPTGETGRKYIREKFHTVPFARGNLLIFARICDWCWAIFVSRNRIDTRTCEIYTPVCDGFGSVAPEMWTPPTFDNRTD